VSIIYGTLDFSLLFTIDTIVTADFSGSGSSNTLSLSGLTQVSSSAVDSNAEVNDVDGNTITDGVLRANDTVTITFPGDITETTLTRLNTSAEYGSAGSGFASGNDYAIFEDSSGQQYILFSSDFDQTRISASGDLELTEQGDAPSNIPIADILCFAKGTMIRTVSGEKTVEDIKVGDKLVTYEGTITTVHWASSSHHDAETLTRFPKLRPVKIKEGAFGDGLPKHDLLVSRQHRMMLRSIVANRMTGHFEVLVPVHTLSDNSFAEIDETQKEVTYYHLLTDQHDVILANGLPCESLHIGAHLEGAIGPDRYQQVLDLLASGQVSKESSLPILENKQARKLIERIAKNGKLLLEKTQPRSKVA
jgi:hypothetical protein